MTILQNYCAECDYRYYETTRYCPDCGAKDPWEQGPAYAFDEDDLPYLFRVEIDMAKMSDDCTLWDDSRLWDEFCRSYWDTHGVELQDVSVPLGFPEMPDPVFDVYFVVTDGLELRGPYLDEQVALDRCARGDQDE